MMILFTQFIWVFILLYNKNCLVLSTPILSGETERQGSTALKQMIEGRQEHAGVYRRERRSAICDTNKDSFTNCTKNLGWDLSKLFKSNTENVDKLDSNYCKPKSGCLDVISSFKENKCNGVSKSPSPVDGGKFFAQLNYLMSSVDTASCCVTHPVKWNFDSSRIEN